MPTDDSSTDDGDASPDEDSPDIDEERARRKAAKLKERREFAEAAEEELAETPSEDLRERDRSPVRKVTSSVAGTLSKAGRKAAAVAAGGREDADSESATDGPPDQPPDSSGSDGRSLGERVLDAMETAAKGPGGPRATEGGASTERAAGIGFGDPTESPLFADADGDGEPEAFLGDFGGGIQQGIDRDNDGDLDVLVGARTDKTPRLGPTGGGRTPRLGPTGGGRGRDDIGDEAGSGGGGLLDLSGARVDVDVDVEPRDSGQDPLPFDRRGARDRDAIDAANENLADVFPTGDGATSQPTLTPADEPSRDRDDEPRLF